MKRFWNKVDMAGDCWIWKAATIKGYGSFKFEKKRTYAHRTSYQLTKGPIPEGLVINHLCENPLCVRPSHLEAVTQHANLMYSDTPMRRNKLKTHCVNGHEFSDDNTYISPKGYRKCRQCQRKMWKRNYYRKKSKKSLDTATNR